MGHHPERLPEALVGGRGAGKTHELLRWLRDGHHLATFPHWSRVLVVPDEAAARRLALDVPVGLPWRSCVWTVEELRRAFTSAVLPGTIQYAVDDADQLIRQVLGVRQGPARIALNAHVRETEPTPEASSHRWRAQRVTGGGSTWEAEG